MHKDEELTIKIVPAKKTHAKAILSIYNTQVVTSTKTLDIWPRTIEEQLSWVEDHSGVYPAFCLLIGGKVVGFASISKYRDKDAYATTVEDSIYIDKDHVGKGFGTLLLSEVISASSRLGYHAIVAKIVSDNQASLKLHLKLGFEIVGEEKEVARKFGKWLNVISLELLLQDRFRQ